MELRCYQGVSMNIRFSCQVLTMIRRLCQGVDLQNMKLKQKISKKTNNSTSIDAGVDALTPSATLTKIILRSDSNLGSLLPLIKRSGQEALEEAIIWSHQQILGLVAKSLLSYMGYVAVDLSSFTRQ